MGAPIPQNGWMLGLRPITTRRISGWLVKSTESTVLQVPRALAASVAAAAVDFGLLVVLVEHGGWYPVYAAVVSYCVGGVVQYVLCSVWVFPAAPKSAVFGFAAFTLLSLVGLAITWAIMCVAHDIGGVHYAVAKILSLALTFCWNFLSRKYWLFRVGR